VITVVLVVYNQLALTRACLASLRGTSEPFELAVVDNASTDGTDVFFRHASLRSRTATTATPRTSASSVR
jgi:GT2 family glycosyltransferase